MSVATLLLALDVLLQSVAPDLHGVLAAHALPVPSFALAWIAGLASASSSDGSGGGERVIAL